VGALAASSNVPWLLASNGISMALRLRGAIAAVIAMTITAVIVQAGHHDQAPDRSPAAAVVVLAILAAVIVAWSTSTAGKALQRNR
jgi:multisubunit Na+/H+ antiporter MnhE subunit